MAKKRIFSLAMAFVLLLGAVFLWVNSPREIAGAVETENSKLLYYFKESAVEDEVSDRLKLTSMCQRLVQNSFIDDYYYDSVTSDKLYFECVGEGLFKELLEDPKKYDYVIVDLDTAMETDFGKNTLSVKLGEIFANLKTENPSCRIMFISWKDEDFFKAHNAFLDNVDIHVNKDLFELFAQNVISQISPQTDDYSQWSDMTLLVDENAAEMFVKGKLLPFIMYHTHLTIEKELEEYLSSNNINILVFDKDGYFYDYMNRNALSADQLLNYLSSINVFAVGVNLRDNAYDDMWQNAIEDLKKMYILEFPFFQFERDITRSPGIPTHIAHGPYDITFIIEDFLADQDLSQYHNWPGGCQVTHKTITYSENGWMIVFSTDDPLWQAFFELWYST